MARTGRPRKFDEGAVVHGAMEHFWQHGYAATSQRSLAEALGVLPGSLHSALGDKHTLFIRALTDYVDGATRAGESLGSEVSPLDAIRVLFAEVVEAAVGAPGRGCMMGNVAAELAPDDESARRLVRRGFGALERGFAQALNTAQEDGKVRGNIDCEAHARMLVALLQGLHLTARAETDPHRLDDVIDAALGAIRTPDSPDR